MTQCGSFMPGDRIFVRVHPSMRPIVPEYLNNVREDVGTLKVALERHDYDFIARLGHSIKGSANLGFDYLNEIGLSLERTARSKELHQIAILVNELEDYLDRVEPVYDPV